jgi:large subunit ribosomal protein L15
MKLHDLRPPAGSNTARTRVGRGIAAGKGKTAGRGTKGQKARAGGSIPPWFEGGQTPLHMRIPKLRGFKNKFKLDYEVVNVGDIAARIEAGAFAEAGTAPKKGEQLTINADILRAVGLVRNVKKPLKILGNGDLSTALFVVADAFTKSATEKIIAAGGAVNVLEIPTESRPALGFDVEPAVEAAAPAEPKPARKAAKPSGKAAAVESADVAEIVAEPVADEPTESPDAVADATAADDATATPGDETSTERTAADGDESA